MKKVFSDFFKSEKGINTVELVIILAVLVTLAFVFKDFIMNLANSIFSKITAKTEKNIDDLNIFLPILRNII